MKCQKHLPGAVLPTALVVSTIVMLTVIAVISLWEADLVLFSKHRYRAMQKAHIESLFTLYREYPEEFVENLSSDGTFTLYDTIARSRLSFERRQLGLYEKVSVTNETGDIRFSRIFGKRYPYVEDILFYHTDTGVSLTLTGKIRLKGNVRFPHSGIVYGQVGSVLFEGEEQSAASIKDSDSLLPEPKPEALITVEMLKERSVGNMEIDSSWELQDTIIVGNKIRIHEGFSGSAQIFASDSIVLEKSVTLHYPSGLYSKRYIGIDDSCKVNGYAIVDFRDTPHPLHANYIQSRLAVVRGLVWVRGYAQLQGIVSGAVFLDRSVYLSPQGYYENIIYDATVLENPETAWPLWLDGPPQRKEAKWLN